MKVAIGQVAPVVGELQANLDRTRELTTQAVGEGVDDRGVGAGGGAGVAALPIGVAPLKPTASPLIRVVLARLPEL